MLLISLLSIILGLSSLHEAGYKGEGMTIAVIDCGFYGSDSTAFFPQEQIIGRYDLVEDSLRTHEMCANKDDQHGSMCLSTMLYSSDEFTGTAPKANYILIRTEELYSENKREVDRLEKGIYMADSLGADIITISLGYYDFDNKADNYTFLDLDGKSSASRAATEVANRHNRIVCIAAGNYGSKPDWGYITVPGDADSVLTVGACGADTLPAAFTGKGPTADGRVKPEVAVFGKDVTVFDPALGSTRTGSGTSFATPELAGMVACLWQALPHLTATELREHIIQSGHLYPSYNNTLGYGVPNAWTVYKAVTQATGIYDTNIGQQQEKILYNGKLYIVIDGRWYDLMGKRVR